MKRYNHRNILNTDNELAHVQVHLYLHYCSTFNSYVFTILSGTAGHSILIHGLTVHYVFTILLGNDGHPILIFGIIAHYHVLAGTIYFDYRLTKNVTS